MSKAATGFPNPADFFNYAEQETEAERKRSRAHLTFVREQGCVVRGKPNARCFGAIQAHHVRTAANSGIGMKPPDACAVGLCGRHHRELHDHGKRTFERRYGVDLSAAAKALATTGAAAA